MLSDDLESFLSVPLRRKVPQFCTNVVATDKVNGYTVLITENALWNIPLHLGIFNAKGEIVASCSDGDDIYYVNADNELYHQHTGSPEAFKIAEIPDDEVVSGMMADDKFLYYISNKQVLKRIKSQTTIYRQCLVCFFSSALSVAYQDYGVIPEKRS